MSYSTTRRGTNYEIVPATEELANIVAAEMREDDANECDAWGLTPLEALRTSMAGSRDPLVGLVDGIPAAVFGCNRRGALSLTGIPWMLTTALVLKHRRFFLEQNRRMIAEWLPEYERLFNVVDARYVKALNWMRWLGFKEHPAQRLGPKNLEFIPFEMVKQ